MLAIDLARSRIKALVLVAALASCDADRETCTPVVVAFEEEGAEHVSGDAVVAQLDGAMRDVDLDWTSGERATLTMSLAVSADSEVVAELAANGCHDLILLKFDATASVSDGVTATEAPVSVTAVLEHRVPTKISVGSIGEIDGQRLEEAIPAPLADDSLTFFAEIFPAAVLGEQTDVVWIWYASGPGDAPEEVGRNVP